MSRLKTKHSKFDHSTFRGTRIESSVPRHPGICFVWYWNEEKQSYDVPPEGVKRYRATRRKVVAGKVFRVQQFFERLEDARSFRATQEPEEPRSVPVEQSEPAPGPAPSADRLTFDEVVEMRKQLKWRTYAESTKIAYEKLLKYFEFFRGMDICSITPRTVDEWLRMMTSQQVVKNQHSTRENYHHELATLSGIFRYYAEYHDDPHFSFPIKKRHWEAAIVKRVRNKMKEPMTPEQFGRWISELRKQKHGLMKEALACTQRSGALRVSEAAAIHWEDINWEKRFITIRRAIIWPRRKGVATFIQDGFKNGDEKEVPITPDASRLLLELNKQRSSGLVFQLNHEPLEYRFIQFAYNKAFKAAKLPFRATHVMRRTGTSWVLDASGGDVGLAKQILGNSDWATVALYAKRQTQALRQFNDKLWDEDEKQSKMSS